MVERRLQDTYSTRRGPSATSSRRKHPLPRRTEDKALRTRRVTVLRRATSHDMCWSPLCSYMVFLVVSLADAVADLPEYSPRFSLAETHGLPLFLRPLSWTRLVDAPAGCITSRDSADVTVLQDVLPREKRHGEQVHRPEAPHRAAALTPSTAASCRLPVHRYTSRWLRTAVASTRTTAGYRERTTSFRYLQSSRCSPPARQIRTPYQSWLLENKAFRLGRCADCLFTKNCCAGFEETYDEVSGLSKQVS